MAIPEDTEERKQELEAEAQDALDFGDSDYEEPEKTDEDQPWDEEEEKPEEEQPEDEKADDQEVEDKEVATEEEVESTEEEAAAEEDEDGVQTFTLDGKKFTAEEIAADPELISKMATHYNQVPHFQKIAEDHKATIAEREEALAKAEAENQRLYNEWTRTRMQNEDERKRAAQAEADKAAAPPPRPATDILKTQLKPYIDSLKTDGRLTEDEVDEHSGLISEYIYDTLETRELIKNVTAHFAKELDSLKGFINPAIKTWDEEQAIRSDADIQKGAAAIEGYEALAKPEKWDELKAYITNKISNSPKDSEGRPLFDPVFDAETMAEQFDAMEGKAMRAALGKKKKAAKKATKDDARKAGGSATSGGKAPKKRPKPKKPLTEADEALNWGDNKFAGG